jgi:cytochrome c biogenesis protein CcmG/thiol:disulfide interchange protein DsbE
MSASASPEETPRRAKPKAALILPLVIVVALLAFLFVKLRALRTDELQVLPSALIGKTVPDFALPGISGLSGDSASAPGLSSAQLKSGKVSLLNVWASWCAPCVAEHPLLADLSRQGVPIYSINYKDKPEAARRFLANHGNPFRAVGTDENGFTAIDFGVYGVPETFVIGGDGRVVYRFPGPLTPEILAQKIMPAIRMAEQATATAAAK